MARTASKIIDSLHDLRRSKRVIIGLTMIAALGIVAVLAGVLAPQGPFVISAKAQFRPPSLTYPMGTDNLGRNVLVEVIYGIRVSLLIGFVATGTALIIGSLVGAFAGFFGGKIDSLLMRTTELFQVIPRFFFALVIISIFGATVVNLTMTIGLLSWPSIARLIRAEFLTLREREFVEAARSLGASDFSLMFREIFPNASRILIVMSSLEVVQAILIAAGLSFLGLGDPNVMDLGSLTNAAQAFIQRAWWLGFFPGFMIVITTLAMAMIGDGLKEVFELRGSIFEK
jgi:peptide/nickel transport system permease protein